MPQRKGSPTKNNGRSPKNVGHFLRNVGLFPKNVGLFSEMLRDFIRTLYPLWLAETITLPPYLWMLTLSVFFFRLIFLHSKHPLAHL